MNGNRATRRAVALVAAAVVALPAALATPAAAAPGTRRHVPPLRLAATTQAVTVERLSARSWAPVDLKAVLVAGDSPFEIRVRRRSYHDPVVAEQVVRRGGKARSRPLPAGLVRYFDAFDDFFRLTLTNSSGDTVLDTTQNFCPNGDAMRSRPGAPVSSPYPFSCPIHQFTLGTVWGIQAGWATPTTSRHDIVDLTQVPDGTYTATLSVAQRYRSLFGIPGNVVTVQATIATVPRPPRPEPAPPAAPPAGPEPPGHPVGPRHPRPDLIPIPAFGIEVRNDLPWTPEVEPERLAFSATVWNAGPSPLVVDGFRRTDEAVMDTYQYFFTAGGRPVGSAPVGAMEWDARTGHEHWHFRDFAAYRLLAADRHEVVRSQKEAFCLANTDAIDLLVRNADWQPENTDLHSSCGSAGSSTVREALATGHGDTYIQSLPGQAFDIGNLPNGTYYIEIIANPDHRLYESRLDNNGSLRQVILGGTPGARTVLVPPYELIDSDPPLDVTGAGLR